MNALVIVHLLRCQAKAILTAMPQEAHAHPVSKRQRRFPRSHPRLQAIAPLLLEAPESVADVPWHKVG